MTNRYTGILIENRYGTNYQSGSNQNPQTIANNNFCKYFEANHVAMVLNSHLAIIFAKRTQFVGTKTLCAALKTV
jgi:importin-7